MNIGNRLKSLFAAALIALSAITGSLAPVATVPTAIAVTGATLAAFAPAQDADAAAMSDYLENKIVDQLFRNTSYTFPTTLYFGLTTTACSDSATGTEVATGSYARVAVTANTTNFAGTQSAGSTSASSGTGGTTSNNGSITFPAPTASWGSVTHVIVMDASTSGNLLFCIALTVAKTINNGDAAPSFAAAALTMQIDN